MVYNADGNWATQSVTSAGVKAQVLEERPTTTGNPTVVYVYGLGLISQTQGGVTSYYGRDGLGTVRYLTRGDNGQISDTYLYDAFGINIGGTGTTANSYRYTGEQFDSDLGMYYLRARYYRPEIGRFWTMDSELGDEGEPKSLHLYAYGLAAPTKYTDPSGHLVIDDVMAFANIQLEGWHYSFASVSGVALAVGISGPEITTALDNTLSDVALTFNSWPPGDVVKAARGLKALNSGDRGGRGAWDISVLHEMAMASVPGSEGVLLINGSYYNLGTGAARGSVLFRGKAYYASAVNFALFGEIYRLSHDFFESGKAGSIDKWLYTSSFSWAKAVNMVRTWKHYKYGDYGLSEKQAEEFMSYGYYGLAPSSAIPCQRSKEVVSATKLTWVWRPVHVPQWHTAELVGLYSLTWI